MVLKLSRMWHQHRIMLFIVLVVMGLVVSVVLLNQPHLVVVDVVRAVHVPSQMLARSKLSKDKQAALIARFTTLLPEVINDYGKAHHVTVVGATVFISQSHDDITNTIIQKTFARLKLDA